MLRTIGFFAGLAFLALFASSSFQAKADIVPGTTCPKVIAVNQTTSTDLYTSTNKIYICTIMLVSATQQGLSISEGTGSVCATGKAMLAGGSGGTIQVPVTGGFSVASPFPVIISKTAADHLCLEQSGAGNVSGFITYNDAS